MIEKNDAKKMTDEINKNVSPHLIKDAESYILSRIERGFYYGFMDVSENQGKFLDEYLTNLNFEVEKEQLPYGFLHRIYIKWEKI